MYLLRDFATTTKYLYQQFRRLLIVCFLFRSRLFFAFRIFESTLYVNIIFPDKSHCLHGMTAMFDYSEDNGMYQSQYFLQTDQRKSPGMQTGR